MINVIKLGGGAGVDHSAVLQNLAQRIQSGEQWVLIHGASDAANQLSQQVGYPAQTITTQSGHTSRYTDARTIELYAAAAATVNQTIVAQMAAHGIRVVGLAGPNIIRATRKTAIRAVKDGRSVIIRDDFSGTITDIDRSTIQLLLSQHITPVIAPLAMGEAFERLNVDGDLVAATVARQLQASQLIILTNVPGLLRDVHNPESLIPRFDLSDLAKFADFAAGRMKKKLLAAEKAAVACTILADSRVANPIDVAIAGGGTHIISKGDTHVA